MSALGMTLHGRRCFARSGYVDMFQVSCFINQQRDSSTFESSSSAADCKQQDIDVLIDVESFSISSLPFLLPVLRLLQTLPLRFSTSSLFSLPFRMILSFNFNSFVPFLCSDIIYNIFECFLFCFFCSKTLKLIASKTGKEL